MAAVERRLNHLLPIMKFPTLLVALLSLLATARLAHAADSSQNCGCSCCAGKSTCCCHPSGESGPRTAPSADSHAVPSARHPLKGIITAIDAERSALMVKHEEIPGFMRAMTMLLKVDAATLQAARKGQAITGTLVQRDDGFWLEDMKPAN